MNGAQIYKNAFGEKRTYVISIVGAVLFALLLAGLGIEEGIREEMMLEQEHEEEVASTVPYAATFMQQADSIGWEWEMLAAVAFHESHYNPKAHSPRGASGLMQLMPKTYRRYGLNDSTVFIAEHNIEAAAKCFANLDHQFRFIKDRKERTKFVLASYNAGSAHILDARQLAKKYGKDPNKWDNAEFYLDQLKYEEFYTDSVVQYGYFGAGTTISYVHAVLRKCDRIKRDEQKLRASIEAEQKADSIAASQGTK